MPPSMSNIKSYLKQKDDEILEIVSEIANGCYIDRPVFIKLAQRMIEDQNSLHHKILTSKYSKGSFETTNIFNHTDRKDLYSASNSIVDNNESCRVNNVKERINMINSSFERENYDYFDKKSLINKGKHLIIENSGSPFEKADININYSEIEEAVKNDSFNIDICLPEDNESCQNKEDEMINSDLSFEKNTKKKSSYSHLNIVPMWSQPDCEIDHANKKRSTSVENTDATNKNTLRCLVHEIDDKVKTMEGKHKVSEKGDELVGRSKTKTIVGQFENQMEYKDQNKHRKVDTIYNNIEQLKNPEIEIVKADLEPKLNDSDTNSINKIEVEAIEHKEIKKFRRAVNRSRSGTIVQVYESKDNELINDHVNNQGQINDPIQNIKKSYSDEKLKIDECENGEVKRFRRVVDRLRNRTIIDTYEHGDINILNLENDVSCTNISESLIEKEVAVVNEDRESQILKNDDNDKVLDIPITDDFEENKSQVNSTEKELNYENIHLKENHDSGTVDVIKNINEEIEDEIAVTEASNMMYNSISEDHNLDIETTLKNTNEDFQLIIEEPLANYNMSPDHHDENTMINFRMFCNKTILTSKLSKRNVTGDKSLSLYQMIYNFFTCYKADFYENEFYEIPIPDKEISPTIFELGNYLLKNGKKTKGIFRSSAELEYSQKHPFDINEGKKYDYKKNRIIDNAVVFKAYLRVVLKGVFSKDIASKILMLYKDAKAKSAKDSVKGGIFAENVKHLIQKYMIFTLDSKSHELLKLLFDLFRKISKNISSTQMSIESLSTAFATSLFPSEVFMDSDDYLMVSEIIEMLYYSEIEKIDAEVYEEFNKVR